MRKWPSTLEQGDDSGWTPLHIAVHLGNWRLVRLLLKNDNSRAYARNKEGLSALHIAAKENNYPVVSELMEACLDISELLDNRGRNALHAAAESGGWAVVHFFSETPQFEGLINEKDEEGNTPLHMAVVNGHYWIASFLLEDGLGVDSNATNKKGITPMDNLLLRKQLHCRPTVCPLPPACTIYRFLFLFLFFLRELIGTLHEDTPKFCIIIIIIDD
ncbi:hypothetical protein CMV_023320 [Castanea mollissima]|uniref:Uncharacterized protein n=1 Tax=Castanea mollissima TaxID=60419 RepID=A0A8J4QCC5_9ROSI|nr:hypothetical protein CMV_023320 [Castanea mollissima]